MKKLYLDVPLKVKILLSVICFWEVVLLFVVMFDSIDFPHLVLIIIFIITYIVGGPAIYRGFISLPKWGKRGILFITIFIPSIISFILELGYKYFDDFFLIFIKIHSVASIIIFCFLWIYDGFVKDIKCNKDTGQLSLNKSYRHYLTIFIIIFLFIVLLSSSGFIKSLSLTSFRPSRNWN